MSLFRCMNPGAIGISLPWAECVPLAAANGFEGMDIALDTAQPASWYTDLLTGSGLRVGGTGLPINFRQDEAAFSAGLPALKASAKLAQAIGLTRFSTWILSFSDELPFDDYFKQLADRLGRAAAVLGDHGCQLGLEFLGPKTLRDGHRYEFIHTMDGMLELAAAVGPNAGLLLDSWHWYTAGHSVAEIAALTPEQVVYVHVNDAPAGVARDEQIDNVRCLPGETGVQDIGGFLQALQTIGYDGPVVPEPFVPALAQLPAAETAAKVGAAMQKIWRIAF